MIIKDKYIAYFRVFGATGFLISPYLKIRCKFQKKCFKLWPRSSRPSFDMLACSLIDRKHGIAVHQLKQNKGARARR